MWVRSVEEEEEEEREEESLFKADAVDEEDPERDRATQATDTRSHYTPIEAPPEGNTMSCAEWHTGSRMTRYQGSAVCHLLAGKPK